MVTTLIQQQLVPGVTCCPHPPIGGPQQPQEAATGGAWLGRNLVPAAGVFTPAAGDTHICWSGWGGDSLLAGSTGTATVAGLPGPRGNQEGRCNCGSPGICFPCRCFSPRGLLFDRCPGAGSRQTHGNQCSVALGGTQNRCHIFLAVQGRMGAPQPFASQRICMPLPNKSTGLRNHDVTLHVRPHTSRSVACC
jgi:hypothetical protein